MINLILRTSETAIHNFESVNNTLTTSTVSDIRPYNIISQVFDFQIGDMVIVLMAAIGAKSRNITKISSATRLLVKTSGVDVQRVFIFTEDVYCLKKDTAEEIIFLKQLIKHMEYSNYQIYHCERDVQQLNTMGLNIKYFDWYACACTVIYGDPKDISLDFRKKLCCLNRRFDEHRYLACAVLSNYHAAQYTQHYSLANTEMFQLNVDSMSDPIRSKVLSGFENLKHKSVLTDRSMPVELVDNFEYFSNSAIRNLHFKTQDAFCSLVTESRFYTCLPNVSEKTLRAIHCGRPFLLLAPPGTLKLLQQLGIKTFGDFWDESYDDIQDHTQRFDRVMQIATDILSRTDLSIEPLISILKHNQRQMARIPKQMLELNL
jgi:hypothetical protein